MVINTIIKYKRIVFKSSHNNPSLKGKLVAHVGSWNSEMAAKIRRGTLPNDTPTRIGAVGVMTGLP
jgi:hypothetical protein